MNDHKFYRKKINIKGFIWYHSLQRCSDLFMKAIVQLVQYFINKNIIIEISHITRGNFSRQ
jgi:hypothetical protein